MRTPTVSVVMSVFNGERFLREAVESILEQSFRDFEFIIVDDGSTDGSALALNSYRKGDARIRLYRQENNGLTASLNRGCSLAQGRYIARMDADDIAVNERLMWQVDFMEARPQIGVVGGAVEWIDARGKSLGTHGYPAEDSEIKATLLHGCAFWHPTVLFRKSVFASAGGYRKVVVDGEDYDLWLRVAEHFELANLESVVLKYRIHPYQVSLRRAGQQALCILAAQAAAMTRRSGRPDPLDSVKEVTPELLVELGVTESRQQCRLAAYRRFWIQNMCMAGEYAAALNAALETLRADLRYVERWQVADLYLTASKLWLKQARFAKSLLAMGQAVITWPFVARRLLEPLPRRPGKA